MKLTIKNTCCPHCASLLVADNGTLTCEAGGHDIRNWGWHRKTQELINAALRYSASSRQEKDGE